MLWKCLLLSAALIVSRVFEIVGLMSALRDASNHDCTCSKFGLCTSKFNSTVIPVPLPSVSANAAVGTQTTLTQASNDIHSPRYGAAMTDGADEVLHFHWPFDIPVWQHGTPTSAAEFTLTHVTAMEDRWAGRMMLPWLGVIGLFLSFVRAILSETRQCAYVWIFTGADVNMWATELCCWQGAIIP